jgi:cysteine-rich repeat protein
MSMGSLRRGAPWAGAALLGVGVVSAGACGGLGGDELFNSGAASSGVGPGGASSTTVSTASTASTMVTTTGQGGDTSSTTAGPGGAGGASTTSSGLTTTSTGVVGCGDGIKDPGEQCDQMDFGGFTCTNFKYSDPAGLTCAPDCKINLGLCKATCDGQLVEPGEVCDGANLDGHTCAEVGFSNPAGMKCAACQLDSSGCAATCDGQKLETGEVCDGAFLNGHTCVDLGYSKTDGVKCTACQLDGVGCKPTCGDGKVEPTEQCDDGNTNAGDGCDPTCHTEVVVTAGTTCGNAVPVSIGLGSQNVTGSTVSGGNHSAQGCTSAATDRVYAVKATANGFLTANLVRAQTTFDSVLYLTTACSDAAANAAILCNDSFDPQHQVALNGGEVVSIRVQQNQTVYLFVDGLGAADQGTYQLHLDLSTGLDCNDPVPIPLEIGTGMKVRGSTTGINALPNVQGSCAGQPGGQVVYAVTRAVSGPLDADTIDANTNYNSVLYARSSCGDTNSELDCSNAGGTGVTESISVGNVNGGAATYVYIDGSQIGGGNASGNYGIIFTP